MPVLIDGNNLLFAARDASESPHPPGRTWLCQLLGKWAERTGEQVTVVFDGPSPAPALAAQIHHPALQVDYSGPQTADELVIEELNANSAPRRLTVVSTDREIRLAARRRRATPVRADDYWRRLLRDLSRPPRRPLDPPEKFSGQDGRSAEEWLRELGLDDPPPPSDNP